jgi:phage shock protein PspC (stress-responsive transcriptional regulator)
MSDPVKRLYRSKSERMIGGICGGMGAYMGIDPTVVRVIFVLITLFWPFTLLLYLVLMLLIPDAPDSSTPPAPPPASKEES